MLRKWKPRAAKATKRMGYEKRVEEYYASWQS
jgi:hypothetical protein